MFAVICAKNGSAIFRSRVRLAHCHPDLICDDSTFFSGNQKIGLLASDGAAHVQDFEDDDSMPEIDRIRDTIMTAFNAATGEYRQARSVGLTIPSTHAKPLQRSTSPTSSSTSGRGRQGSSGHSALPDYPKMVSGYKKDSVKRGYKYATITLVGDHAPLRSASSRSKRIGVGE